MIDSSVNIIRANSKDIELAFKAIKELHVRVPMERDAVSYFINDPSCYLLLAIKDTAIIGSLNGYSFVTHTYVAHNFYYMKLMLMKIIVEKELAKH